MLDVAWAFGRVLLLGLSGRTRWAFGLAAVFLLLTLLTHHPSVASPLWWTHTALLIGTPLCIDRSCAGWDWWSRTLRDQVAAGRTALADVDGSLHVLAAEQQTLEQRIDNLHQLYAVTKAAAPALHTQELVIRVEQELARSCNFQRFRCVEMARGEDGRPAITATHAGVPSDRDAAHAASCHRLDGMALQRYAAAAQPALVTAQDVASLTGGLWQISLGWAPLLVESQWVGLWIIEGLQPAEFDRFLIIANQASLQLARVQLYQRLEALAVTDGLTGLLVRRHFVQRAQEELERARRLRWDAALLMLDLDHFKEQNDRYGHLVGDAILQEIAQRIRAQVRQIDLVGRWGGEEFVVLLVDATAEEVGHIAERIRATVAEAPIRAYDETITQTLSIGVALYPDHGTEYALLTDRADAALYAAKARGRNHIVFHHA